MTLPKRYNPKTAEPTMQDHWQEIGVYQFDLESDAPVFTIDTPPPTVSGNLHLGHAFSYSHPDFMARFWRMNGRNVFYPMGYDDNGLPTERLVERWQGVKAKEIGRSAFIQRCLAVSEEAEKEYETLWKRLGLSIDWRYTYRTIDDNSRRISQRSFIDLYNRGLAYRQKAPTIWCPECQTAIAQADLNDLDRESQFYTLEFRLENGDPLHIATTRPELLPACVAVFVHPKDGRFQDLVGQTVTVPHFGQQVPLLTDPGADPEKGTGAVMCCTFGDTADVEWWHTHKLALVEAIDKDGRMSQAAPGFEGLTVPQARTRIVQTLEEKGLILDKRPVEQTIRIHERCDTPVEYIVTWQWFVRLLDFKSEFLALGEQITWHPDHMKSRYRQWVENLGWDWCITRQRYFGVTFPVWYCEDCGETILASEDQLPVDPTEIQPGSPCTCGSTRFYPEEDVMDTWATSSLTPQIVCQWLTNQQLYEKAFPMSLRPQAHEIIRTWAFYTLAKSHFHFETLPWDTVAISGWGLAPEGAGKISKSRGGGPMPPMEMIDQYSADAVRYWAASTGLGKDAIISEEKVQAGARLITKLWNVARFSQRFLENYHLTSSPPALSPADSWILTRTQQLIRRSTTLFTNYDYATAKSEIETFFWRDLADNYLEMAKKRLYDENDPGASFALSHALTAVVKMLAPIMPHITERIYTGLLEPNGPSVHTSSWPAPDKTLEDETAAAFGETLVEIATAVRRYKSDNNLSLGTEIPQLLLVTNDSSLASSLEKGTADITSITRAQQIKIVDKLPSGLQSFAKIDHIQVALVDK